MGKKRIAQTLARAGLHLGVTTVRRMLKERDGKSPEPAERTGDGDVVKHQYQQPVTAKYTNHVWQVDLTVVPTSAGFWVPWMPRALSQTWPFCWWVACVVDHFSRRVMGVTVFPQEPTSIEVRSFLGRVISTVGKAPKYIISDKGGQFWCPGFKTWCKRRGMTPRYTSTGSPRATAIIERFFLSLKAEWLRRIQVPLRRDAMRREVVCYLSWFAEFRPHQGLDGRTPTEVHHGQKPANEKPRFEPRRKWPKASPCALPHARLRKRQSPRLDLVVRFYGGSKHLPVVELKQVA